MKRYIKFTATLVADVEPLDWRTAEIFVREELLYPDWPTTFRVTEIGIVEDE